MGNSPSSLSRPSRITSGKSLINQTKEVRELSNALFTFMFTKWEDKEIWDIANKPEDYVIALSDLIEKQFSVIGYITQRNQVGEIYFVKADTLMKRLKSTDINSSNTAVSKLREGHKQNARIIAFYFIRLFQIMGALLMVVKDITYTLPDKDGVEINLGHPSLTSERPYLNQRLPRFSYEQRSQSGGSYPSNKILGPYEFLRKYLDTPSSNITEKYPVLKGKYKITSNLYFEYTANVDADKKQSDVKNYVKGVFYISTKNTSVPNASVEFTKREASIQSINMDSGLPIPFQSPDDLGSKENTLYPINVTLSFPVKGSKTPENITFTRITPEGNDWKGGVKYIMTGGTHKDDLLATFDAKDFKELIERVVLFAVRQENTFLRFYPVEVEKEKSSKPTELYKVPDEIESSKAIDSILKGLKNKSQPHCIARALQLIDVKSIEASIPDGTLAKTDICRFVLETKSKSDKPIPESYKLPIRSVGQLFGKINPVKFEESQGVLGAFVGKEAPVTTFNPGQLKKQPSEADDLSKALDRLTQAFELTKGSIQSFSDFTEEKLSPKACQGKSKDESIPIKNSQVAIRLQDISHQLFAYHVNQSIEISTFLKIIFNINKDESGQWKVDGPKASVLNAGFPLLNELTDKTRDMLVNYYSGCEELYRKGVKVLEESDVMKKPSEPVESQPVASQPVVSQPVVSQPVASSKPVL